MVFGLTLDQWITVGGLVVKLLAAVAQLLA